MTCEVRKMITCASEVEKKWLSEHSNPGFHFLTGSQALLMKTYPHWFMHACGKNHRVCRLPRFERDFGRV